MDKPTIPMPKAVELEQTTRDAALHVSGLVERIIDVGCYTAVIFSLGVLVGMTLMVLSKIH